MRDVTEFMSNYRECARHLWNTYFFDESYRKTWAVPGPSDTPHFDKLDRFEETCRILFTELVLEKIGEPSSDSSILEARRQRIRIVPIHDSVRIMINRGAAGGGYWANPIDRIGTTVDLRFIEYFDWDQIGILELQYYRVKIAEFPHHPELIGREALIECRECRVQID